MMNNFFKTSWRHLVKSKGFSLINIFGLAIGLACFVLIALYVTDELSYDRYNERAADIYRINADIKFGAGELSLAVASDPMGATLKRDYPQVEEYTRVYASSGPKLIKKGNDFINEPAVAHVDSTFFRVFTLPAIEGNTFNALDEPNTVVITETAAKKYFGTVHAVGKLLEADRHPYKVTAVIRDVPHNSHFNFDFFFSMKNVDYSWGNYLSNNFHTYLILRKGTDYKAFNKNFLQVLNKYVLPQARQLMNINSLEEFEKAGNKLAYALMPLLDIHLHSDRFPELGVNGNIQYVYIFSAVAIFVLVIACINFMNLSTARSGNRAKEVGIRKVLGTEQKQLVVQFLVESTLTVIISMLLALVIATLVLPYFNDMAAKSLSIKDVLNGRLLPILIALPFVVGLLAGIYPAFFLSRYKPAAVLKGNTITGFRRSNMRNVLVIFQFSMSIFLIIGTLIVHRQLHYIQTKNLGFNKDQVLIINGTYALDKNVDAFKNEVLSLPGVRSATISGFLPVSSSRNDNSFSKEAVLDVRNGIDMQRWSVDYDYIPTLGMEITKGRNFSKEFGTDSNGVIINETTEKFLGYDNPIGKKIYTSNSNIPNDIIGYTIIGVVKNFHFESLRQKIGPLCLLLERSTSATSFKVSTKNIQELLGRIRTKWTALAPAMPFSYRFLDDAFDSIYRAEQRVGEVALTFAILAIFIACLGLFGLVTYMAEKRTREIGIRKVLGASVEGIVGLLSLDFLKLVAYSFLLATPIAWYFMSKWLQDFAYRTSMSWWIFLVSGILALLIALLTISFQAIRAAIANPVKSLRTE